MKCCVASSRGTGDDFACYIAWLGVKSLTPCLQRESAVLLFTLDKLIRGYPPSLAEGLTLKHLFQPFQRFK
jgi:hypothetical protein